MFRNNAYATIWEDKTTHETVKLCDTYADVMISTSRKTNGEYKTDFNGKVRLFGAAFEKVKGLNLVEGDRIQLKEVGVTNKYDKIKKALYVNYTCFDFDVVEKKSKEPAKVTVEDFEPIGNLDDDDLPF